MSVHVFGINKHILILIEDYLLEKLAKKIRTCEEEQK